MKSEALSRDHKEKQSSLFGAGRGVHCGPERATGVSRQNVFPRNLKFKNTVVRV